MRTRRTKEQIRKDIYNKDVDAYNFYVVNLDTMKAETGFEFKEDAVDVLNDYDDKKKYKVVSKKALKSLGVENPNESFKYEAGGDFQSGVYAKGGGVKINTEVILSENRPNGAEWQGVVKPFMLKSIEENQYAGGFKRYEIDIYDEVDREPTKEEIKKANEFFDKIGGRYAGGGKIKPFMYKENNSTIMINGTKADVKKMYLDYKNNFLSVSKFAEYYNISERQANSIIESGRKYAKEDGYYAGGGEFMTDPTFGNFQNNVYADGGGVGKVEHFPLNKEKLNEDAKWYADRIKSGKQTTTIKNIEESIESDKKDLYLLEIGRITPAKIIGTGYKGNTKKIANTYLLEQIYRQTKTLELLQDNYADGGVTENYVSRRNLNTITIKKGNQKLTYKISDVLNGAYKLESGAKLEDIAFYVPKRSIVKVQLKTGKDFKPANGYWIKDGAKPIHVTKFDDGGAIKFSNGGGFGEVAFIITNDYYGNLDLGFNDITINDFIYTNSFMRYSDAMKTLIDFLKSEDGEYIIKNDPKSKFEIVMVSYNPKLDKYKDLEPQRKILYTIKASMINDFTKKSIFNEGGVMSRLLTRKKDQPKVETTNEDIDLKEDSRIRVRPSSFVRKDKEGDWMMKKNSSKEARSYAGGGKIRYEDYDDEIDMWDKLSISQRKNLLDSQEDLEEYGNHSEIAQDDWDELDDYVTDVLENNFKNKMYAGGGNVQMDGKLMYEKVKFTNGVEDYYYSSDLHKINFYCKEHGLNPKNQKDFEKAFSELKKQNKISYKGGGKVTFSEKAKAIAKNFEGKRVEPKYQKEYGKVYDKTEAKEVGNKIAGSQKASYDAKLEKGSEVKKGKGNYKMKATTDLAKKIRKDGEKWTDALRRASQQMK